MDADQQLPQTSFSVNSLINFKNTVIVLLAAIFINLAILDIILVQDKLLTPSKQELAYSQVSEPLVNTPVITPGVAQTATNSSLLSCSQPCLVRISQTEAKLNKSIAALKITPTPVKTAAATPTPQSTQASSAKEYFIPFGTGISTASDWQGVPGAQVYINSASYPNIKSVVFEVSLHIPNANQIVNVRLYNATDSHAIVNSDLTFNGNGSSLLNVSPNIVLDSGNKLYQVQIKTQLQYQAVLDQARVHITLQ